MMLMTFDVMSNKLNVFRLWFPDSLEAIFSPSSFNNNKKVVVFSWFEINRNNAIFNKSIICVSTSDYFIYIHCPMSVVGKHLYAHNTHGSQSIIFMVRAVSK